MNIGTITRPTDRGQIVIPSQYRKALGINKDTVLNLKLVGEGILVQPMTVSAARLADDNAAFLALLKKYQGSWGPETPEERKRRIKRRKIELEASKKRKLAW